MTKYRTRSNAPIFWGLFGAGGMLSALFVPAMILITGILVPLGILLPANAMSYQKMLGFAHNFIGKGFIFAIVSLSLWFAVHRVYHSLHEFGIHAGVGAKLLCYGTAMVVTVIAAVSLLGIGF